MLQTITAAKIAENLPMTVRCLNDVGLFKDEKVTFIKVKWVCRDWCLMGSTRDNVKRLAIFDKDQKFGVIE